MDFKLGKTNMSSLSKLRIKIFADTADRTSLLDMYSNPLIKGFTTNPTLMRVAGITDYRAFAKDLLHRIPDRPISFEVFSDEFDEMEQQALEISGWGDNVYVKIPITNTQGQSSTRLIARLVHAKVKMNITAVMTLDQVSSVIPFLAESSSSYISIFAGRIADTGRDPILVIREAVNLIQPYSNLELIWASSREILNIFHADSAGCHIITVTLDMLKKIHLIDKDLNEYSLETVKMFYEDAQGSGNFLVVNPTMEARSR